MITTTIFPMTAEQMQAAGWERPDFILVSGDAYIDSPSFGSAIIARVLEQEGYKVALLPQPNWRTPADFKRFGRPRLGFLVNSGNIDSMVNHYTAAKKQRSEDAYTPGGKAGARPDRAVIVYTNMIRQAYSKVGIAIGGVEASLRRNAHYDYWDDKVRRSILIDSGADLLLYGMGERAIVQMAAQLQDGKHMNELQDIQGTAYITNTPPEGIEIPSYEQIAKDKSAYCQAFNQMQRHAQILDGEKLIQAHAGSYVVVNPPARPLERRELDKVYALPFTRDPHPFYTQPIPANEEVKFSITSCRGCIGACSFCALSYHQGRVVTSRSIENILKEARSLTKLPDFKGYIHDVGGPTANFRVPACKKQLKLGACPDKNCLFPKKCNQLTVTHSEYREVLARLRELEGVKKVFVRSGLRYDYMLYDRDDGFMRDLIEHHISGQLKIAPEHISERVLELMGKPSAEIYERFCKKYKDLNISAKKEQYLVPYFMSSHPGSDMNAAIELACYMKDNNIRPEQVQDFYPTPGTRSTAMFYTGMDPLTMQRVYVPRSFKEKQLQRALLQYFRPQNAFLVRQALKEAERDDLIGTGKKCLIQPAGAAERIAMKHASVPKAPSGAPSGKPKYEKPAGKPAGKPTGKPTFAKPKRKGKGAVSAKKLANEAALKSNRST